MTEGHKLMLNEIIYDEEISVEDFIKYLKHPKLRISKCSTYEEVNEFLETIEKDLNEELNEDFTRVNCREDILQYTADILDDLVAYKKVTAEMAFNTMRYLSYATIEF